MLLLKNDSCVLTQQLFVEFIWWDHNVCKAVHMKWFKWWEVGVKCHHSFNLTCWQSLCSTNFTCLYLKYWLYCQGFTQKIKTHTATLHTIGLKTAMVCLGLFYLCLHLFFSITLADLGTCKTHAVINLNYSWKNSRVHSGLSSTFGV